MSKAFIQAASHGDAMEVARLLNDGIDVNYRDSGNETALSHAARAGCEAVVRLLLARGSLTNVGSGPLPLAVYGGHDKIVDLLLRAGANVEEGNDIHDGTPLTLAAYIGNGKTVARLLSAGAKVNATNRYGTSALIYAADEGHDDIVRQLIAHGANLNHQDHYNFRTNGGATALHYASMNGHQKIVKQLINAGAMADVPDESGRSALIHAAISGHGAISSQLVAGGADVNRFDNSGLSAIAHAMNGGCEEIVRMLRAQDAIEQ